MIKLSKLGKVLGPKGLMPNPKLGSVSENIKDAVTNAKSGQVEIRNDKDGNIGVSIGKKSFSDDQLLKNYNAILEIKIYNMFYRLNEEWVDSQTGRAYTAVIKETDLAGHRSDFNEFEDRIQNPSMFSSPRSIKIALGIFF